MPRPRQLIGAALRRTHHKIGQALALLLLAALLPAAPVPTLQAAPATPHLPSKPAAAPRALSEHSAARGTTPAFTPRPFGDARGSYSMAAGDLNGDGRLDIVADRRSVTEVYLGDGDGGFEAPRQLIDGAVAAETLYFDDDVDLGDLNGDGALDIVIIEVDGGDAFREVYFNDGHGGFATPRRIPSGDLWDLNGDGALDIVGDGHVYTNDGHGNFVSNTAFSPGSIWLAGDLNGDGSIDVVGYDDASSHVVVYLNDGAGGFGPALATDAVNDSHTDAALGDMNGDGFLDLVTSAYGWDMGWPNLVYFNDGKGRFGAGHPLPESLPSVKVALGDLNGDGTLDMVFGNNESQPGSIYLNDGKGNFADPISFGGQISTIDMLLADMNGDGALDIVASYEDGQSIVYLNDTAGDFPLAQPIGGKDNFVGLALGDFNGDGMLDLVGASDGQPSVLYLNNGRGGLTEARNIGAATQATAAAVGDLNGDGKLDVVIGDATGQSTIYLGDGAGNFPRALPFGGPTSALAIGDVNGDGAPDIVAVGKLYLNDGKAAFTAKAFGRGETMLSIVLGDLNGDGRPDIVAANGNGPSRVYLNGGNAKFTAGPLFGGNATNAVALGDVNHDGALDIVVANRNGLSNVYLNNGHANFTAGPTFGYALSTKSVALGDLNGDGRLDIVAAPDADSAVVALNDGAGGFATVRTFGAGAIGPPAALGDLNGDGMLDIVVAQEGRGKVFLNSGRGDFAVGQAFSPPASTVGITTGDLNGDGHRDIVALNRDQQSVLYLGDGQGHFAAKPFGDPDGAASVALADLNNDGRLDIIVGFHVLNINLQQKPLVAYLNDGRGGFTARPFGEKQAVSSLAAADLNGDGLPDIVVGRNLGPNALYLGDGAGNFGAAQRFGAEDVTGSVAIGDVNNDGAPDVVVGKNLGDADPPSEVYLNDGHANLGAAQPIPGLRRAAVQLADLNGDGALDLIACGEMPHNVIYLNDGHGAFGPPRPLDGPSTSFAVADVNGDGAPDLITARNQLLLNDGRGGFGVGRPFGNIDQPPIVAAGDLNGDGAPDLITGGLNTAGIINLNDGRGGFASASAPLLFGRNYEPESVAMGDMNGDGNLDLIVGYGQRDRVASIGDVQSAVYLSDGHGNFATRLFGGDDDVRDVAVGDLNGDNRLDIVLGDSLGKSSLYLNDGQANFAAAAQINDIAKLLADVNGDGALDIITLGALYLNDGHGHFSSARPFGDGTSGTSVAAGDMNGDGATDLVVGRWQLPSVVYLNDGGGNFGPGQPFSGADQTVSVALGDLNGDGALDIVAGNNLQQSLIYLNDGAAHFTARPFGGTDSVVRVALGDLNGDGPLDIIAGYIFQNKSPQVYLNNGRGAFAAGRAFGDAAYALLASFALGDLNNDGALDIAAVNGDQSQLFINTRYAAARLPNNPTTVRVTRPGSVPEAGLYSSPEILTGPAIDVPFALSDPEGTPVRAISATFSLDGGGSWRPALPASGTITANLATNKSYVYRWDTFASGVFGQSDNVVFRIQALPSSHGAGGMAGQYRQPEAAATTFPFRLRGTQVRVMQNGAPQPSAQVYRLPAGQQLGGAPIGNGAGAPFTTDANGYLRGRGALAPGDRLLALVPISHTATYSGSYTLYATNGTPSEVGLDSFAVAAPGVQTIEVSAAHPLALFDINVALEWDASTSPSYLQQLAFNLRRTSQYLYDFSNGQLALGHITVHQNADDWALSDVVIHATNHMRPYATQGGIVITPTIDPQNPDVVYASGQVHMGASWNRYGTPGENLGDDWSIILAHELSHYLLFQDDSYLGIDPNGFLVAVGGCTGSAMGDVYTNPANSEFIADQAHWDADCGTTLPAQTLHRTEWQTIKTWYPQLNAPPPINPGPSTLPFDFTDVGIQRPLTPTLALGDPTFYLDYVGGQVSSNEARAFLERDGKYVFDLGSPNGGQNRLLAHGAQPGDRVCVFDRLRQQYGCEAVALGDDRIALKQDASWAPVIQLTPVTSRTFELAVDGLPDGLALKARLFPEYGPGGSIIDLADVSGAYRGAFALDAPTLAGNLQLWVDEPATEENPRRETIVAYAIGGNPGYSRAGGGYSRAGGGYSRAGGGYSRAGGGYSRAGGSPLVSPDGQMIFFTPNPIIFGEGQFYTIQGMAALPPLPPNKTVIGQGYNLVATAGTPVITGSISFQYLGNDVLVAGADENQLSIHFWDGQAWHALPTVRSPYFNLASARSQGVGVYALMAGVTTPQIISVSPTLATNDTATTLTISGSGFLAPAQVSLIGPTSSYTLPVTAVFSTAVTATIPAGLEACEYRVVVRNGDGGISSAPGMFALFSPSSAPFYDFFESGPSKWELNGAWGIATLPDGNRAMTDSPAGNYDSAIAPANSRTTTITSRPFSLDGLADPVLTFRHDYALAHVGTSQDIGLVEISADDGATWTTLASFTGGGAYEAGARTQDVGAPEWANVNWKQVRVSLRGYTGMVRLRFSLEVDQTIADKGWVIDDVVVQASGADNRASNAYLPLVMR